MQIRPISRVVPRALRWLWQLRLPFGKLAILDGDPGQGKSFVALDLCARLSRGAPFPGEVRCRGRGNSLYLHGEDGAEDTLWHRAKHLGADMGRVFIPEKKDLLGPGVQFPAQIDDLDAVLRRTSCQLVVIDPIMAFLDASVSSANDQSVRRALTPLSQVAEQRGCLILMIRHPNKHGGSTSLYRGAGSVGIVGACRSALVVAGDPQNPNHHVLAHVKSNLGALQPSLAYRIAEDGQKLTWLGKSPWTADQLLAAVNRQVLTPRELAKNFLLDFLAEAPRLASDVWASAQNLGLAERTIYRAKRELKIRAVRIYVDNHPIYYWLLPDNVPPDAVPPSLEPWLKPLRERYRLQGPTDESAA